MTLAALAAITAAALFALATALQHRTTADVAELSALRPRPVFRYVGATMRHRIWLAGLVAEIAGLGLHALALNLGSLTLAQTLLVTAVIFALPLRSWLDRRRPSLTEVGWGLALATGLVVFLVAASPTPSPAPADRGPALAAIVAMAVAMLACLVGGTQLSGGGAAAVLGLGAGLGFAATAALLKATTNLLVHGPVMVLTHWPLYTLVVAGPVALLLNQMAFHSGPLRRSLPMITVSDPLVSVLLGVGVYDERLRSGVVAWTLAAMGLGLVVVAAVALTRGPVPPVHAGLDPAVPPDATPPTGAGRTGQVGG